MHSKSMIGMARIYVLPILTLSMLLLSGLTMGQYSQKNSIFRSADINTARTLLDKNEEDSALYYLNKYLSKNASDQEALFLRARIFTKQGNLEKAHGDYNALIALNSALKEVVYSRGIVRYQLRQYENALTDFHTALELSAGETQTAFFKMEGNAAIGITTINGMDADIWNNIGLCYYQLKGYEQAIQAFNHGLELDQKNLDLLVNRALALEKQGKTEAAILDYEHVLATNPQHSIADYNLMQLKKAPETHELDAFIINNPGFSAGYTSRGLNYYTIGEYTLAVRDFKAAVELEPENTNYLFNLALCYEKLNNIHEAESLFLHIVEINPRHDGAYFNLGNIQFKQGAFQEAISYFTLAHHANPDNMDILHNRALAYQKNGNLDRACEDMKKVQKADYPSANSFMEKYCAVKP